MTLPEPTSKRTLRIIDANLNRIGEGLRVLEDIARLLLNDALITQQLKDMRHHLLTSDISFQQQLLQARDSDGDVGMNIEVSEETDQRDLPLVVVANSRRVQESLRTLEELAKITDISPELDPEKFKQSRFSIYNIEKSLISRLLRQDKLQCLNGLYFILDTQALRGRSHIEVARQVINGGARTIQFRDKVYGHKELLLIAGELCDLCKQRNVLFIINDYIDIAIAVDADGIHLGQEDLPISTARNLLPLNKIIGYSTHTIEQVKEAASEGADYIAFGSIYPTTSKENATVVGTEMLHRVRESINLPIVAIGGINHNNVAEVIRAGADSIAVISAILQADDIERATSQIVSELEI